ERPAEATERYRLFFVGADPADPETLDYASPGPGRLTLIELTLRGGLAKGGDTDLGGGGAGMGGAIFNQGVLVLDRVTITANEARGGSVRGSIVSFEHGGGGMGSDAYFLDTGG